MENLEDLIIKVDSLFFEYENELLTYRMFAIDIVQN